MPRTWRGGIRGREALDRLRNVVGRVEASWRPATAEEGFEIVRRRPTDQRASRVGARLRRAVPEPLAGPEAFKQRDVTAGAFADLYRAQAAEFPPECRDGDDEKRIQAAYPIHPEIFDRLYSEPAVPSETSGPAGRLWQEIPSSVPDRDPRQGRDSG